MNFGLLIKPDNDNTQPLNFQVMILFLFRLRQENTKQYMKKHNVPKDLQRRVVMWYDYSWAR